ncbi:MAG: B12-binding domain-containing radical SAM protein [Theionarchaea archaeon]|nr:B12-binding domain-containing radical SAM protein [Theionarchaea archaeon]
MCGNYRENVLLINPPQNFEQKKASEGLAPPLGLFYLKAMIPQYNTKVLDLSVSENPKKTFVKVFESEEWDDAGITVLTYSLNSVQYLVKYIKQSSDMYLVAGGPHATLVPLDCLKMGFDAVVVGEGELIIADLIRKKPKGIIQGKSAENLDEIPFPARNRLENTKYGFFGSLRIPGLSTSIMTSRGCPYKCRFCGRIVKGSVRRRSVPSVIKELKKLRNQKFKNIFIADDHFITNKKWVAAFCHALKKEKLKFNFFYQTRIDNFDRTSATALREAGTQYISFGIESVNPRVLQFYNKTGNPVKWRDLVKKVLGYCNDTGIYSQASLIVGAPMETEEMFWESYNYVSESGADTINVNPLVYFVGSDIWREAVEKGVIKKNEYLTSVSDKKLCPILPERIAEICDEVFHKVARNIKKRVLLKTLRHMDGFRMRLLPVGAIEFLLWKLQYESCQRSHDALMEFGYGKRGSKQNMKR